MQNSQDIQQLFAKNKQYFHHQLNEFIYLRTYAHWLEKENRRETWEETVSRYMDFMRENLDAKLSDTEYHEIHQTILQQEVMPSMRLLQFAGKAVRRTQVCAYNCAYIAPTCLEDFGEIMYVCMCGTGVGFSVESQNVETLPTIKIQTGDLLATYIIQDSKEGWSDAFVLGLKTWYDGKDISFDFSQIRPAGSRLKTFGGKSSGPQPLRDLLTFVRAKILARQGRRLNTIQVHDIICKIGEMVVSGGVRRTAMMSLSDLDDQSMRDAKKGAFYYTEPQRTIANNSAVYLEKPTQEVFLEEWVALMKSGTGERGIFNRDSLINTLPTRRIDYFKEKGFVKDNRIVASIGTNPCGEVILQSKQFCNLTEVIARPHDTKESLLRKIRIATILGTYQATFTDFKYLSKTWQTNCEEERLLGVSITGHWDCAVVREADILVALKKQAIATNETYALRFGINAATAVTCVKPSGTVSQLVDCAPGMHPRHAPYYVRRIRISASDALFKMLQKQGVPYYPEVGQFDATATTFVLEFPVKAPAHAIYKNDLTALAQLEHWKRVKENYTEHNPSVTISVSDDEWFAVADWLYQHWDIIGGLSFLPRFKHVYELAPYEAITTAQYETLTKKLNQLDFSALTHFELSDETDFKTDAACLDDSCGA